MKKHRWVISALVLFTGIFNLQNKSLDNDLKIVWWVLTPVSLVILIYRWVEMIKENKKEQEK